MILNTPGSSGQITCPPGCTQAEVQAWGAGAGGTSTAGGGGGGYSRGMITGLTPNTVCLYYHVGLGGSVNQAGTYSDVGAIGQSPAVVGEGGS